MPKVKKSKTVSLKPRRRTSLKPRNKTRKRTLRRSKSKPTSAKTHLFGKVYADWCGACQALKPNWDHMLTQLKRHNSTNFSHPEQHIKKSIMVNKDGTVLEIIQIQDSDYENYKTKYTDILGNLEANGYPTIFRKKMHIPDSPIEYYQGERTPENMIKWALDETRREDNNKRFMGGKKYGYKKYRHNTAKRNNCSFSQRIANFWGWK